jgi:hypothetical protein
MGAGAHVHAEATRSVAESFEFEVESTCKENDEEVNVVGDEA